MTEEAKATLVPEKDKQVAETHSPNWWWAEPLEWSTRLLIALTVRVKGGGKACFDKLRLFHKGVTWEELCQSRQRAKH